MKQYTDRFKEIMGGKKSLRDVRLANLMTDLEQAYNIPALVDVVYANNNPFVVRLYRTVSLARKI